MRHLIDECLFVPLRCQVCKKSLPTQTRKEKSKGHSYATCVDYLKSLNAIKERHNQDVQEQISMIEEGINMQQMSRVTQRYRTRNNEINLIKQ